MCDTVPGSLLLLYDIRDPVAELLMEDLRGGQVEGVSHDLDLRNLVRSRDETWEDELPYRLHRLKVPEGQENWKLNSIFQRYQAFQVAVVRGNGGADRERAFFEWLGSERPIPMTVSHEQYLHPVGATLAPQHAFHKTLVNLPPKGGEVGSGTRVAILDTGLEPGVATSGKGYNWIDDAAPHETGDQMGHGSAVALIIADLAPGAALEIHKVTDDNPNITETTVLAALTQLDGVDVVNISLAFGLTERDCSECGRRSHGARSRVFETILDVTLDRCPGTIVVAAAGNGEGADLSYPARYGDVVAVCATTAAGAPTGYTNHGATDQAGDPHEAVFLAPGGDDAPDHVVTTDTTGVAEEHSGTSFAAPYVSAMIALHRSGAGAGETRDRTIRHFALRADTTVPGFSAKLHGNGLIRY